MTKFPLLEILFVQTYLHSLFFLNAVRERRSKRPDTINSNVSYLISRLICNSSDSSRVSCFQECIAAISTDAVHSGRPSYTRLNEVDAADDDARQVSIDSDSHQLLALRLANPRVRFLDHGKDVSEVWATLEPAVETCKSIGRVGRSEGR